MQCTKCGTTNPGGAKFCEECGARLMLSCPGCGTSVPAGKKFCSECGTALTAQPLIPQSQVPSLQFQVPLFGLRTPDPSFTPLPISPAASSPARPPLKANGKSSPFC